MDCSCIFSSHRAQSCLLNQSVKSPISSSLGEKRLVCLDWKTLSLVDALPQLCSFRTTSQILPAVWRDSSPQFRLQAEMKCPSSSSAQKENHSPEANLMTALKGRRTEEAWIIFGQLKDLPGSACLSRLVAQLSYEATPSSLARAQAIVTQLQNENKLDLLDCNSLGVLAMASAKTGTPRYGATIIRLMLKLGLFPHVKAWSAVLSQLGKYPQAFDLTFDLFQAICDRITEAEKLLNKNVVAPMKPDTGAFNAVLNACAMAGNTEKAEELIQQMHFSGVSADVLTYNILIKLYARVERKELLVGVVEKMLEENIEPCISTFYSLVAAYVGLGDLRRAELLVRAMREGRRDICSILKENYAQVGPSVLSQTQDKMLIHSKENDSAASLLLPRSYRPDSRIYTTLMKGYMQNRRLRDVIRMLRIMQNEDDSHNHPNEVTYTTAISAFVKMGLMDEAYAILQEMAVKNVSANLITYNSLLNGYCRLLQIQKAKVLMQEMKETGLAPDVVSYNTMINGCIHNNDNMGALTYFNEMRDADIAPSRITYTTVMKALGMNGQPRLAAKVFMEMQKDLGVRVDVVAWNMLIESYCRAGLMEDAMKVLHEMKEHRFHPTVATYGSLVNGFARTRKPGEALALWEEIKERTAAKGGEGGIEPLEPDEGLLDSLVEICVRTAFFRKALEIAACMEEHKIPANKTKYKRIFVELHLHIYTSKHASKARQDRRAGKKQAAEAFKFWLGLSNNYREIRGI
eukprot:Gb_11553 [translate_table: standard]